MTGSDVYAIWLSEALRGDGALWQRLTGAIGSPAEIYGAGQALKDPALKLKPAEQKRLLDKELGEASRIAEQCETAHIDLLTISDDRYPERLRQIYDPPALLYLRGSLPEIDDEICVGMVGTRRCTEYGRRAAEQIAREIARLGAIVVSGMAEGIDTAAHKGALKGEGRTIAVLGTAIDTAYPRGNEELYRFIAANGCVLSEHAPGAPYQRGCFPRRNRIISGLSLGVVVAEAPARSGALITARLAAEQNRDVFAIPGNITSPSHEGANDLLKAGAKPVTCGLDILSEYVGLLPHRISLPERRRAEKEAARRGADSRDSGTLMQRIAELSAGAAGEELHEEREETLPPEEQMAAVPAERTTADLDLSPEEQAVRAALADGVQNADELTRRAGLPVAAVSAALVMLEIKGYIHALPGGRFTAD